MPSDEMLMYLKYLLVVPGSVPKLGYGVVYDLQGCMAKEGRPMPSDEAVQELERILYLRDDDGDQYSCPLMTQEAVSRIDPDSNQGPLRYDRGGGSGFSLYVVLA